MGLHSNGRLQAVPTKIGKARVEQNYRGKHSSLLLHGNNYCSKSFYSTGPGTQQGGALIKFSTLGQALGLPGKLGQKHSNSFAQFVSNEEKSVCVYSLGSIHEWSTFQVIHSWAGSLPSLQTRPGRLARD